MAKARAAAQWRECCGPSVPRFPPAALETHSRSAPVPISGADVGHGALGCLAGVTRTQMATAGVARTQMPAALPHRPGPRWALAQPCALLLAPNSRLRHAKFASCKCTYCTTGISATGISATGISATDNSTHRCRNIVHIGCNWPCCWCTILTIAIAIAIAIVRVAINRVFLVYGWR